MKKEASPKKVAVFFQPGNQVTPVCTNSKNKFFPTNRPLDCSVLSVWGWGTDPAVWSAEGELHWLLSLHLHAQITHNWKLASHWNLFLVTVYMQQRKLNNFSSTIGGNVHLYSRLILTFQVNLGLHPNIMESGGRPAMYRNVCWTYCALPCG